MAMNRPAAALIALAATNQSATSAESPQMTRAREIQELPRALRSTM